MKTPLTYALRGRKLVSIQQVASGLACDCICPACLHPLIARKGQKTIHHFAHYRQEECPFALESMLHQLAKNILAREKRLRLPAVRIGNYPKPLFPTQMFYFDRVWLEHRTHHIVPDLIVQKDRKYLMIEIALTHKSPRLKLEKIRKMGIATVEINLSQWLRNRMNPTNMVTEKILRKALLNSSEHRQWLFNPKQQALEAILKRRCKRKKVKAIGRGKHPTYAVYPCPKRRRLWQTGALSGQTYAQVFRDCLHCPYCLEIQYKERLQAYQWIPDKPQRVYCWGREEGWLEQFWE